MRATLMEVLGPDEGRALYTLAWLEDRVRWHLDATRTAAAYLALDPAGHVHGHTLLRTEEHESATRGLFSTVYVQPESRHQGVATALLRRGEEWIRAQNLPQAATYTAKGNQPLIDLFSAQGYTLSPASEEMVCLSKPLEPV
jgi:GNAT superfamily N-acetyltransferase